MNATQAVVFVMVAKRLVLITLVVIIANVKLVIF
jgi:hypothetical protein